MKNTDIIEIKATIARSQSHTEPVTVEVEGADIAAVMAEINAIYDGDTDYTDTNDKGRYDVWGCKEGSEDMDWRINVIIA